MRLFVKYERMTHAGTLLRAIFPALDRNDPRQPRRFDAVPASLFRLLQIIHFLPMTWRKWILNACRIQSSMLSNIHLSQQLHQLDPPVAPVPSRYGQTILWHPSDIATYFEHVYDSPLNCSILSYFVRAESTAHPDQFRIEVDIAFNKEIMAALHYKSPAQEFNYAAIFGGEDTPIDPVLGYGRNNLVQKLQMGSVP